MNPSFLIFIISIIKVSRNPLYAHLITLSHKPHLIKVTIKQQIYVENMQYLNT